MNFAAVLTALAGVHLGHQEVNLIHQVNEFYGFDHNIFLLDASLLQHHRDIISISSFNNINCSQRYTLQTVFSFDRILSLPTLREIASKNMFLIILVESSTFERNFLQFLPPIKRILELKASIKIGVFLANNVASMDVVEKFFRFSWSRKVLNIFCAFYPNIFHGQRPQLNVFKFDPFGGFKLENLTRIASAHSYFHEVKPNFRRDPLRLARMHELNNSLLQKNFWSNVVNMFNATPLSILVSATNTSAINDEIVTHEVIVDGRVQMYPHRTVTALMAVPHAKPYSDFTSLLGNIASNSILGYTFATILMASLILIVADFLQKNEIFLLERVADVINVLMNENAGIKYQQLRGASVCVIVPLTFAGLIVANVIVSIFQSNVTVPRYQPQIDTITDLYNTKIPIFIHELVGTKTVIKLLEELTHFGGWINRISPMSLRQLKTEIETFNHSIAFTLYNEHAEMILQAQKRLDLKAYHVISGIHLIKGHVSYRLPKNFVYVDYLNNLLLRWQSSGLYDRWFQIGCDIAVENAVKNYSKNQSKVIIDPESSTIPTWIWYGWTASTVVFVVEIVWSKCHSSKVIRQLKGKF